MQVTIYVKYIQWKICNSSTFFFSSRIDLPHSFNHLHEQLHNNCDQYPSYPKIHTFNLKAAITIIINFFAPPSGQHFFINLLGIGLYTALT